MRMKRLICISVLTVSLLLPVGADFADFYFQLSEAFSSYEDPNTGLTVFPTLLIPMGGKYEGMGTAYAAVASDSGFLEANPSGSATLEKGELSFLHHSWIADSNMEGVIYTMRYDDLGIGFGGKFLYVPFTGYNEWGDRESRGYISESIATLNVAYNFFSSYHFYGLSIGGNLKAAYRNIPASIYAGQSAITAMVDLGLLTRFNLAKFYASRSRNFSLGAVIKNVGLPALEEPLPTVATFGLAYSPLRPLLLAFDFNYPISFYPEEYPAERWHIAGGMNVNITEFLSLQGGFHFKADNPRISLGSSVDLEKVSFIVNYNLDLSGRINPLDKFSIEAKLNLGDRGRLAQRNKIDDLYLSGLEAYARGDISAAIRFWQQVLELDPTFTPAQDNIETALASLELQKRMDDELEISD
jgi:tetratricopeptide (TPR) repeat protein